jgi:hypothetical protein
MIKIRKPLLYLTLFISSIGFSQDFVYQDYDWPEDPSIYVCPDSLSTEPEVILFKKTINEFGYQKDDFIERYLLHWVTYLSTDEAIERNNRVYLPVDFDETLELTKARVINPDGNIIELNEEDINTSEDENGNKTYYFAIKGLEKGSILEILYIYYLPAQFTGVRLILQNDIPQINVDFELISPDYMVFEYLGKNGFGIMESDTSNKEINRLVKHLEYIPPFKREEEAFVKPNLMQVVYKLGTNLASGGKDVISYETIADNMIENYTAGTKKEMKIVSKWIDDSDMKTGEGTEMKLRKFEAYLKKSIAIFDASTIELEDIEFVSQNKVTNAPGFIKIMALACNELNIQYEIVITSDRGKMPFEPKFESYNYLQDFLLYFSEIDKYLDPNSPYGVLGIIPAQMQDNYGVFFKRIEHGKNISGKSEVRFIEGIPAEESHHDMTIDVTVTDDFSALNVSLTTLATGYFAAGIQPYYDILEPEEMKEFTDDQVKWISENMELKNSEAIDPGFENLGIHPFIIEAEFTTSDYFIKARDKYLVKLGLLIGPQVEMYQESKRNLPVDMGYRKFYHREIKLTIPEGYKIGNLDDLNLNKTASDDNQIYAGFVSTYTINGNELNVTVDEYYHKVHFTVEEFEEYRAVINSAADFNKIVLYLERI